MIMSRFDRARLVGIALMVIAVPVWTQAQVDENARIAQSLVSSGDSARLEQVLAKARRGQPLTIGVIGGSITAGAGASSPATCYGRLIGDWWQAKFPKCKITFVNAGIGATGSNYGALRAKRDLLSQNPDFVVVEFAVNDSDDKACAETLEGLLRQVLSWPTRPAVVLLFTMQRNGANAQDWHGKVGAHYHLPMISFRDALWPEIVAGHLKWEDVEADIVHPNDRGHAYAARFVTAFLESQMENLKGKRSPSRIKRLPKPLISDLFEHVALLEAADLMPISNQGWTLDQTGKASWQTRQPGSVLEFEIPGSAVLIMDWHIRGPEGQARVQVDDLPPVLRDGWFDQTWGGYRGTFELARGLKNKKHRVRVELLEEKNPQSTGHEFKIFGFGAAGI